jgi:hypothetical protein
MHLENDGGNQQNAPDNIPQNANPEPIIVQPEMRTVLSLPDLPQNANNNSQDIKLNSNE